MSRRVLTDEERAAVVAEALGWLGTPYHHQGRVKGVGVDCAMFLAEVYSAVGLIPYVDPRPYPRDWHMHRSQERFLGWVEQFAVRNEGEPRPGDVALFRFGRCVSHGAVVVTWPEVVHSVMDAGVVLDRVENSPLVERLAGVWTMGAD